MEKAADYRSLSRLVMAQIKPGVITNNFMDKSDYLSEIESGALSYHVYEGGLLLFRRREDFLLMNYYLSDPEIFPQLPKGETLLVEPVFRPGADRKKILDFLEKLGFETLFFRERLIREKVFLKGSETETEASHEKICVCQAEPGDAQGVYELLTSCFDPQAACLPTHRELDNIIAEGRIICVKDASERIAGVLHFKPGKKSSEMRHLATAKEMRGQGLAQKMTERYFRITESQASQLWVRLDNKQAIDFHRNNGYHPDGWTSAVLRRKERK